MNIYTRDHIIKQTQESLPHILDLSLNAWFLLELSVTVACAPDLKLYLKRVMSWVEIIAVVPYFITFSLNGVLGLSTFSIFHAVVFYFHKPAKLCVPVV